MRVSQALVSKEFENKPMMTLAVVHDGLDVVREILTQAGNFINEDALFGVELVTRFKSSWSQ